MFYFSWPFTSTTEIYTDGSFKNGRGAWAYVIVRRGKVIREASGFVKQVGSNRMEFQAAIEALRGLTVKSKVIVYSDSRILIDAVTLPKVARKKDRPHPYAEQVQALLDLQQGHAISWKWVKAHSGVVHNERCDELCIQARAKGAAKK